MTPRLARVSRLYVLCFLCLLGARPSLAQEPSTPQSVTAAQLQAAIDKLGNLDYATRTAASRTVRRTPVAQAVPTLMRAVSDHADGYVRYRALVLLTGFNDPRAKDSMREAINSPNDRLRAVAYSFFEHNPDPAMLREVGRGEDFFRSAVIESLGDYKAQYAVDALIALSKLDGPLQDDAALALGKIGDKRALETLAGLQRTASRQTQR